MYLSQTAIAWLYLWSFLTGVFLGAVYDCLRLTRLLPGSVPPIGLRRRKLPILGVLPEPKKRRATAVLIFLEDFLFCLIAGVAAVLLFYEAFDGKIRVPALALIAAGFGAFHVSFGRLALRVAALVGFLLEVAVRYICHFAALPVKGAAVLARRGRLAYERRERAHYTKTEFGKLQKAEEAEQDGKNKEKTIQPEPDGQNLSRGSRGRVHRGVRQQRHAVQ